MIKSESSSRQLITTTYKNFFLHKDANDEEKKHTAREKQTYYRFTLCTDFTFSTTANFFVCLSIALYCLFDK